MFRLMLGDSPERALLSGKRPPPPPEIILLQEVVDRSLHAHIRPHLTAAGYTLTKLRPMREYYEIIAVREPLRVVEEQVVPLDSGMGRELTRVVAEADGQRWLILTAHLESMREGSRRRLAQAQAVLQQLRAWDGPAVFGGDTNLRVAEAESLGPLLDAWQACGAEPSQRWTYISSRTGQGTRYDRVWGNNVAFSGFRTIGDEPVTGDGQTASDHLGVEVSVAASSGSNPGS